MADPIDEAQNHIEREAEAIRALQALKQQALMKTPITLECTDCGEALPPLRQQMRATRCVICQGEYERRSKLYKR